MRIRIRRPSRRTKSIGQVGQGRRATPAKPTRGIRGATQAQLRQIRQRQQSAKPITPAQRAAIRKARPTGTPRPQSKPPTSAQRAAMRKQAIARRGNTATGIKRQDETIRRAVRQKEISPGQARSLKMIRQKAALGKVRPRTTTKRRSRRLV